MMRLRGIVQMVMIFLASWLVSAIGWAGEIALTFDDAPRAAGKHFSGKERAKKLTETLAANGVKEVAFFCNSIRMDEEGKERILFYAKQGHIIANHSHSHLNFTNTRVATYIDDIHQADLLLSPLPNFRKWFRFPFLREGATDNDRDMVRLYLKKENYFNGYVTVDTYDWYMDRLFQQALAAKKNVYKDRLCKAYAETLWESVRFFDELSLSALQRSVRHVLLLHENDLAALCIGDFIKLLRDHQWQIISPTEAYADPIAAIEPKTLALGQGRVAAIARERGYQGPISSPWEDEKNLESEFARRKVFE